MPGILITGGARSGKSHFAQELAQRLGEPVLFVATALPLDEEMAERIRAHRKGRPPGWTTLEIPRHAGRQISARRDKAKVVLIDCITLLISNIFSEHASPEDDEIPGAIIEKECASEIDELIDCMKQSDASFIIVTNEVGEGLVPVNKIGRLYRDYLGCANQRLAREAKLVYLMVAGLPLQVKPPGGSNLPWSN
ncbi:MAG: bifunctional adenosylcobinamide kinase/adenosylcobinamide-phosphate guanylyltransferase [Chloroflexota bacterium]